MQIWGRGIDLERFNVKRRSDQFRRRLGCRTFPDGTSDVLLIWVGRLVPEKRPDIWLDVFKLVYVYTFHMYPSSSVKRNITFF